jgi:hypothetical protein
MNQSERIQVGELWLTLASMYGRDIPRPALKLMLDAIADLPAPAILKALEDWARSSKSKTHPLPAEIRDVVTPVIDDRSIATDLSKRISGAISRRGWTWPSTCQYDGHANFEEAVKAELGELAWEVIRRCGGWQRIHDDYFDVDAGVFTAQLRDHIESVSKMAKAGVLHIPPALPAAKSSDAPRIEGMTSVSQIGPQILVELQKSRRDTKT